MRRITAAVLAIAACGVWGVSPAGENLASPETLAPKEAVVYLQTQPLAKVKEALKSLKQAYK